MVAGFVGDNELVLSFLTFSRDEYQCEGRLAVAVEIDTYEAGTVMAMVLAKELLIVALEIRNSNWSRMRICF